MNGISFSQSIFQTINYTHNLQIIQPVPAHILLVKVALNISLGTVRTALSLLLVVSSNGTKDLLDVASDSLASCFRAVLGLGSFLFSLTSELLGLAFSYEK